jgi:hypothetical protein
LTQRLAALTVTWCECAVAAHRRRVVFRDVTPELGCDQPIPVGIKPGEWGAHGRWHEAAATAELTVLRR